MSTAEFDRVCRHVQEIITGNLVSVEVLRCLGGQPKSNVVQIRNWNYRHFVDFIRSLRLLITNDATQNEPWVLRNRNSVMSITPPVLIRIASISHLRELNSFLYSTPVSEDACYAMFDCVLCMYGSDEATVEPWYSLALVPRTGTHEEWVRFNDVCNSLYSRQVAESLGPAELQPEDLAGWLRISNDSRLSSVAAITEEEWCLHCSSHFAAYQASAATLYRSDSTGDTFEVVMRREIHFHEQQTLSVFSECSSTDLRAIKIAEIALITLFALRMLSNLGVCESSDSLAAALIEAPKMMGTLASGEWDGGCRCVPYPGHAGRKQFAATAWVASHGLRFDLQSKGFGWLSQGVPYYGPTAVINTLQVLAQARASDGEFLTALGVASRFVGQRYTERVVSLLNQNALAASILGRIIGHEVK